MPATELIARLASPAMLQVMLDEAESRIGCRALPAHEKSCGAHAARGMTDMHAGSGWAASGWK